MKHSGQNHDHREHGNIGERHTAGSDCGHASDECDHQARQLRTHASHVGLTRTYTRKVKRLQIIDDEIACVEELIAGLNANLEGLESADR